MSLGQKHKRQRKLDSTDPIIIIAANKTISTGNVIGKTARGKKFKGERENRKVKPGRKKTAYIMTTNVEVLKVAGMKLHTLPGNTS